MSRRWKTAMDSPVEERRKELPRGDANWAGFPYVYKCISMACEKMAMNPYLHLSDEHVNAMAVLACGHEETMKYELSRLRMRGFLGQGGIR